MNPMQDILLVESPRFSAPPTPWRSHAIHGGVLVLWVFLFWRAFGSDGLGAWAAGLVYVAYDTLLLAFVFWQTLPLFRSGARVPPTSADRPSLAIIVAAHNEVGVLPLTLAALFAQTDPPDHVIVADDGSTDGTAAWFLDTYGLEPSLTDRLSVPATGAPTLSWLRLRHGGKARALNRAIGLLHDDIVLTVDADTLLDPEAIGIMRKAFAADPKLVAATGILTPVCGPSVVGRLFEWFQTYEYIRNFLSRYAWARMDSLLLISGAFAGFRRQTIVDVGGFDTDCLVEDYELIHRLRRHSVRHALGWTTAVIGGARARTDAPSSAGAFLRQRRRWFGGFLQTQYWYRDMVGNPGYGWLGTLMLPIKAIDTMQPIYGLTAFALLVVYLAQGRFSVVGAIGWVIGAKIVIDLAFHLWSVVLYRRWLDAPTRTGFGAALLAALVEPFCFQLLRHLGAALGWVVFLTGARSWGKQHRLGIVPRG